MALDGGRHPGHRGRVEAWDGFAETSLYEHFFNGTKLYFSCQELAFID